MKFNYKLFGKILFLIGILTPIAFGLRIFTYWKELEIPSGFFLGKGAGCIAFNILCFAVFFLCLFLTYHKNGSSVESSGESSARHFNSDGDSLLVHNEEIFDEERDFPQFFLHGFARKCAVWFGAFSAFAALLPGFGLISHAISFVVEKEMLDDPYCIIYAALSLASGAFFLLYAFRNSSERSRPMAFFALVPALWCTMRMVIEYRDLTRFLNKSLYVGQFLFVIAAMIFFLYQAQMLLGEENFSRPNAYAFSGLAVAFLGVTARLPQLFAIMGERIHIDLYTSTSLLADLGITVFIVAKLLATTKRS